LIRIYDFHAGTDNGNVATITDCESTDRTQNFDYDSLNRMKDGYTTGSGTMTTNWGETYTIDPWGNLTNIALYSGKHNSETLNAAPASSKNQLPGYSYDAAGNMTSNGSTTYTYDAENRVTATSGYSYVYDANGQRVIKCGGTFPTCGSGTLYWRGTGGDPLAETDFTGAPTEEYVFFNGARIARRDGTGNTALFYFADHLGSTDVITSSTGGIQKLSVYYPYGGEIAVTGSSFANNYKFTGKERDSESGLDEFGARYYASSLGRFMIPDWAEKPTDVPYASFGNPQSLNLYSYVNNNPTTTRDPDGHETQDTLDPQAAKEAGNTIAGAFTGLARMAVGTWNTAADLLNAQTGYGLPTLPMPQYENKDQAIAGAAAQLGTVVYSAVEGATAGSAAKTVEAVPDANVVVRGGTAEMPPAGTTFSGAHGATLEEAASGVPHGTIRTTTAGEVRGAGGTVHSAPEPTRSGVMNDKHVNVTEGANKPSTFSQPRPNPVPKKDRVQ
jgi:RHS repeat-associated protein